MKLVRLSQTIIAFCGERPKVTTHKPCILLEGLTFDSFCRYLKNLSSRLSRFWKEGK